MKHLLIYGLVSKLIMKIRMILRQVQRKLLAFQQRRISTRCHYATWQMRKSAKPTDKAQPISIDTISFSSILLQTTSVIYYCQSKVLKIITKKCHQPHQCHLNLLRAKSYSLLLLYLVTLVSNNFQQQLARMQSDRRQNKPKYAYVTEDSFGKQSQRAECHSCGNCRSWQQKAQNLIWGYEQLLAVKQRQLETLIQMVSQLDEKQNKSLAKIDSLNRKLQAYEAQVDKIKGSYSNNDNLITYYKDRETELLSQLKSVQNQLFYKNVQIKDEIDCKEDKVLTDILNNSQNKRSHHRFTQNRKSEASLIPIIHTTETLGKMLQRNMCDLEKMSQQKMGLQVKHRMAVLRAAELSVLK